MNGKEKKYAGFRSVLNPTGIFKPTRKLTDPLITVQFSKTFYPNPVFCRTTKRAPRKP